jgi:outer membrane protein
MHRTAPIAALFTLASLFCSLAGAQSTCRTPSDECVVVGKWNISVGLGVGARSNPVKGESDIPLIVVPQISYYGKRFFLDNLEAGFTLHESDSNSFNLIAAPGYDRVFFFRNDLQNIFVSSVTGLVSSPQKEDAFAQELPLRKRHTTYLVGPEWTFGYGRISGQLDALREVTGEHDGYEVRGAVAAAIMRPEGSAAQGSLVASTGFTWKSAATVRYYYGIEGLYEPGAAFNPFIKLGYSRPLAQRWTFTAFAHYEYLDNAIANSPIVAEHGVTTVFAGVSYKLL